MNNTYLPVLGISRLKFGTDGIGIRTLIGTYGCSLKCKYCINPKSWDDSFKPKNYTAEELYNAVRIDNLYFQSSGGGITFGGGEPAIHSDFIYEFVERYCTEWNVYMETSLNVPLSNIERLVPVIDKFVIDVKDLNDDIYYAYTGLHNDTVIKNLDYLVHTIPEEKIIVRVPLISGFNTEHDREKTVDRLSALGCTQINKFSYIVK